VLFAVVLLQFAFLASVAQTFTSVQTGPWENGATWGNNSPGQKGTDYPANNDNAIITSGTVVTHTKKQRPTRLVIEANGELVSNNVIGIRGTYINNGIHSGISTIEMLNLSDTIAGSGSITNTGLFFVKFPRTIMPGSSITRSGGNIQCPDLDTLFNRGTLTLLASDIVGLATSVFKNENGAILDAGGAVLTIGIFVASENENTVIYNRLGASAQVVKKALGGYFNLSIDGDNVASQKTMATMDTILNDLKINATTLLVQDTNLYVGGSITLAASNAGMDVMTNQSKVTLNGNIAQSVSGAIDFYDLTIQNSGPSVSFTADTSTIHGGLNIQSGAVSANGFLLIESDAAGDAYVGPVLGSISGDVTVHRFIGAGATGWRFMSAPVSGATLADWNDDFITAGFPGSDFPTFYFSSIKGYDETIAGHQDSGFVNPTGISQSIPTTGGYWVYCGDQLSGTASFLIDIAGPLNTGTINYPITYTANTALTADCWNLVSNPYASVIDWDALSWTKTNVDDGVYVWNTNAGSYASYVNGLGVNGGSNLIASSQAFYIKANAASPALSIAENCKSATAVSFLRPRNDDPVVRVKLANAPGLRETIVRLTDDASTAFDPDFDTYHLSVAQDPYKVYTRLGENDFGINSFPTNGIDSLPLLLHSPTEKITLQFDVNEAAENLCLVVRDVVSGELYPVLNANGQVTLQNDSNIVDQFRLILTDPFFVEKTLCQIVSTQEIRGVENSVIYYANGMLHLAGQNEGTRVIVHDALGRLVHQGSLSSDRMEMPMEGVQGVFYVRVGNSEPKKIVIVQ